MAIASLDTLKVVTDYNKIKPIALTAFDGTSGAEYTVNDSDQDIVLMVVNADGTNAENLTIKEPTNRLWSSVVGDLVVSIPAAAVVAIKLESAKYMDSVTHKITFAGTADVTAAVFRF